MEKLSMLSQIMQMKYVTKKSNIIITLKNSNGAVCGYMTIFTKRTSKDELKELRRIWSLLPETSRVVE
jgi:hypothetical protein